MRAARSLVFFALLPIFAGCQLFSSPRTNPTAGLPRMQGELTAENGQLLFQPCQEQRRYVVQDSGNTSILQESATLASKPGKLFADVRGSFSATTTPGADGLLKLQQLYHLQRGGVGCEDLNFKRLTIRASGNAPTWNMDVGNKGMVLERAGQPALALPYVEEQLGDGRFNLSSEANEQHIELWIAPQRCVDSVTGSVQHLTAELRINGQLHRGCAYFGGSRND